MTALTQLLLPYVLLGCIALWLLRKRAVRLRLRYRHWCEQLDEKERMKRIHAAACVAYRASAPMSQAAFHTEMKPTTTPPGPAVPAHATQSVNSGHRSAAVPPSTDYARFDVPAYVRKGIQFELFPPAAPASPTIQCELNSAAATARAAALPQRSPDRIEVEEPVGLHEQ